MRSFRLIAQFYRLKRTRLSIAYSKGLYILSKGIAKLFVIDSSGKEQIVYMMGRYEMFGQRSIVSNDNSNINVKSITQCEIQLINRDIFLACLQKYFQINYS